MSINFENIPDHILHKITNCEDIALLGRLRKSFKLKQHKDVRHAIDERIENLKHKMQ